MRHHRISLSDMANLVAAHRRTESELYDDLGAFYAPYECYRDVELGSIRRLVRAFRMAGWTPSEYNESLSALIGDRCMARYNLAVDDRPDLTIKSIRGRRFA